MCKNNIDQVELTNVEGVYISEIEKELDIALNFKCHVAKMINILENNLII